MRLLFFCKQHKEIVYINISFTLLRNVGVFVVILGVRCSQGLSVAQGLEVVNLYPRISNVTPSNCKVV